jgi:hypothetical protein
MFPTRVHGPFNIAGRLLVLEKLLDSDDVLTCIWCKDSHYPCPEESNEGTVVLGLVNVYRAHGIDTSDTMLFHQPNDRAVVVRIFGVLRLMDGGIAEE